MLFVLVPSGASLLLLGAVIFGAAGFQAVRLRKRGTHGTFRNFDGRAGGARYGRATGSEAAELPIFVSSRRRAALARSTGVTRGASASQPLGAAAWPDGGAGEPALIFGGARRGGALLPRAWETQEEECVPNELGGSAGDGAPSHGEGDAPVCEAVVPTVGNAEGRTDSTPLLLKKAAGGCAAVDQDEQDRTII